MLFEPLHNHYDVIIIGAGAASIGAAVTLSRAGLSYVVLESRQRIGGRLFSEKISDVQIDLGGAWVHAYSKNNPIWKEVKKLNWKGRQKQKFT